MVNELNKMAFQVGKSYSSAREALFLNGTFVVEYLKEVDGKSGGTLGLAETPVASAILQEVRPAVKPHCPHFCRQ